MGEQIVEQVDRVRRRQRWAEAFADVRIGDEDARFLRRTFGEIRPVTPARADRPA